MPQLSRESTPVKLYRGLVQLYPRDFRYTYAPLAVQLFTDIYRETLKLSPSQRCLQLSRAYFDTVAGIIYEQSTELKNRLTSRNTAMADQPKPFYIRYRIAFILVIIAIAGFGFMQYKNEILSPFNYAKRVIESGIAAEKLSSSWNSGWEDVTANFVADYIQAKYYGDIRTDIGIHSPHALRRTFTYEGNSYTQSLEESLNTGYDQKAANFDPITCSTEAPIKVRYLHGISSGPGIASTLAAFYYASIDQPNIVQYSLVLDQTTSSQGEWKIRDINCISQSLHPARPYTTPQEARRKQQLSEASEDARKQMSSYPLYEQRNDRTFDTGK